MGHSDRQWPDSLSQEGGIPPMGGEISARSDLESARSALMSAIGRASKDEDFGKLPGLVRELRETWKLLGVEEAEGATEDEFSRARRERAARTASS